MVRNRGDGEGRESRDGTRSKEEILPRAAKLDSDQDSLTYCPLLRGLPQRQSPRPGMAWQCWRRLMSFQKGGWRCCVDVIQSVAMFLLCSCRCRKPRAGSPTSLELHWHFIGTHGSIRWTPDSHSRIAKPACSSSNFDRDLCTKTDETVPVGEIFHHASMYSRRRSSSKKAIEAA
jgi:hypothetical protein